MTHFFIENKWKAVKIILPLIT